MCVKRLFLSFTSRPAVRLGSLLLLGLLSLAAWPVRSQAQSVRELDVIVIVDNSASMCCTAPINDPEKERYSMARLFVDLLGVDQSETDYRLGFVFFGTEAELTASLSPIATQADRDLLHQKIDGVRDNVGRSGGCKALEWGCLELARARR